MLNSARAHRTTGHAAEMAFFAVLTLVPSTVAVGSALGLLEWLIGTGAVAEAEETAIRAMGALMGPELADTVVSPFVRAQFSQPQGGVALGGLLLAWWLSSHLFASTAHALDAVYGVIDRRPTITQRFIALSFALASVVVVALTAEMMVVGPLGDPSGGVAEELGLGDEYGVMWSVVRWPFLLLVIVAFLVLLYRFSPNVTHSWRQCVPGAVLGATLWIVAAAGFRLATDIGVRFATGVSAEDPRVTIIGESVSAVVATALWAYLASVAILLGGEFNAMLSARRSSPPHLPSAAVGTAGLSADAPGHEIDMETIGGPERERAERDDQDDVVTDDGREMPPEPAPSPGEADRARLGQEDVSEQAP